MNLINFIKTELKNWGKLEKFVFPALVAAVTIISLMKGDNPLAVFASVCGITYTILAGKGKISCYFIGIAGTLCYAYISFQNALYGNCMLYALYYLPMEIAGIFKWKNHLKKDTKEIIKTTLPLKETLRLFIITFFISSCFTVILKAGGDLHPCLDSFASVFSLLGMYLTVKRCIEQWYVWFIVNFLSCIMWYLTYIQGVKLLSVLLMWIIYLCLSVYFWYNWKRQLQKETKIIC